MNFWRSIRISNGKIFCRRYDMPRGEPRNVRSCWPTREASRRYEPIAALARSAQCGGAACRFLVTRRSDGGGPYRDRGPFPAGEKVPGVARKKCRGEGG